MNFFFKLLKYEKVKEILKSKNISFKYMVKLFFVVICKKKK